MKKNHSTSNSDAVKIYLKTLWKWLHTRISTDLFFEKIGDKISAAFFAVLRFFYRLYQRVTKVDFKNIQRIRSIGKPRVYKLRGYTTTSRVDRKIRKEQNQRLLRNILVAAVIALLLAIFILVFNPFKDLREIFRIIGI